MFAGCHSALLQEFGKGGAAGAQLPNNFWDTLTKPVGLGIAKKSCDKLLLGPDASTVVAGVQLAARAYRALSEASNGGEGGVVVGRGSWRGMLQAELQFVEQVEALVPRFAQQLEQYREQAAAAR